MLTGVDRQDRINEQDLVHQIRGLRAEVAILASQYEERIKFNNMLLEAAAKRIAELEHEKAMSKGGYGKNDNSADGKDGNA